METVAGESLRSAIREVLRRHLDLQRCRVFLFGSEADGSARRGSDIDIGIAAGQCLPGRILENIRRDLEQVRTLRNFDVVDLYCTDPSFTESALKHAERL